MYEQDKRTVLTLDAGGTNFVFSAMQGCQEVVTPVRKAAVPDSKERCLETLVEGFREVEKQLQEKPVAISFAFPGPADYEHGVIGDLPNFPAFRGGVAMGPYLEERFGLPVYINNDGNLFAYGEALAGTLPEINKCLASNGSLRRYRNLLGLTLGTGFGGGVVIDGQLLTGDNGCGGDVWLMRNPRYPELISEESVSIRAVRRVYAEKSGRDASMLTPKDIFDIAEGNTEGDSQAAIGSFYELGRVAGDAIVHALDIVDGLVVIGGGVAGASKYILPGIMDEVKNPVGSFSGDSYPCLQMEVFNLEDKEGLSAFLYEKDTTIEVFGSERRVPYIAHKKVGIAVSVMGASKAISIGAYAYALAQLDKQ